VLPPPEEEPLPEEELQPQADEGVPLHTTSDSDISDQGQGVIPFRAPAAAALAGKLDLGRVLRILKRQVPSRTGVVLDEDATAHQIAEVGIWTPVVHPAPARWLDVALVVDDSASMWMWQQVITEFRLLLEHHGAFRDVRTWAMTTDAGDSNVHIYPGSGPAARQGREHSLGELCNPGGQRIILVISDCIAPVWQDGTMTSVLSLWGRSNLVSIVQMLPRSFWKRSALGFAPTVWVRTRTPCASNSALNAELVRAGLRDQQPKGVVVPVISLERASVAAWSLFVTGISDVPVLGVRLRDSSETHELRMHQIGSDTSIAQTAQQRIAHFRTIASSPARELAELLAAAPLSLPVMHLIRQTMVPEAGHEHLAEVILGGLIHKIVPDSVMPAYDSVQYEFIERVRDELLATLQAPTAIEVLTTVSTFVNQHVGQPLDFAAMLADPGIIGQFRASDTGRVFAMLTATVLRGMGGRYAEVARKIHHDTPPPERPIDLPSISVLPDPAPIPTFESTTPVLPSTPGGIPYDLPTSPLPKPEPLLPESVSDIVQSPSLIQSPLNLRWPRIDHPSPRKKTLRPTLIVGLGGTGQEVLVRVKSRMMEAFGPDALRVIKLAALDTIGINRELSLNNGQIIRLDRNTEFLDIGNVPIVQMIRNLETSYPQIKTWLPPNLPGQDITQGTQMIRPLGRLAFFFHFRRIRDYFYELIRALSSIHAGFGAGEIMLTEEPGINIILVSSICGGTGSGIFLDTVYLIRDLCERLNQPRINLTGILALPGIFSMVSSDLIKANAFAALREIDQFTNGMKTNAFAALREINQFTNSMSEHNFDVEYPGGYRVRSDLRPFNICYLVDNIIDEQDHLLSGMDELAPLIAESVYLQINSQSSWDARVAFDSLRNINDNDYPSLDDDGLPHMTAFSGMGLSSLSFPAAAIIGVCSCRFAACLITQGLLANEPDTARIDRELERLFDSLQIRSDQIIAAVTRDDKGKPLILAPQKMGLSATLLDSTAKNDLLSQIATRSQRFETEVLDTTMRKQFDSNFKALKISLDTQLDETVAHLLEDLSRGLLLITPLLSALRAGLSKTVAGFEQRRKELQESLEKSEAPITLARQRLVETLEALVDIGGRRRKEATTSLITAHVRRYQIRFDIMQLDCVVRVLTSLINTVNRYLRENTSLIDQLWGAAEKFQRNDEEQTRQWDNIQDTFNQNITDSNELNLLYQEYVRDVNQELHNLVDLEAAGPIHTWNKRYPSYEQISTMLLGFAQRIFVPITARKIENELMYKRNLVDPSVRLSKCFAAATPLWRVHMDRVPNGGKNVKEIAVIGLEDHEMTIYKDRLKFRGSVGTTTFDPHRITVLRTKHSVPIHALADYDEFKEIYNRYIEAQRVPLHIIPMPDVKRAQRIFSLALALGLIAETGNAPNYVMRMAHTGNSTILLAQGLAQAMQFLSVNAHLVIEIEQQVKAEITRLGKEQAHELINAYLSRSLSFEPNRQKLERLLNNILADYRQ
jgi:hypothetical protein